MALCWDIYNNAWEKNWGFVPMPEAEFHHMAKDMKHLAWKELSFIAHVDDEPAGFMFAVPDYNEALVHNRSGRLFPLGLARMLWHKRDAKTARVMALGVKNKFRSRTILPLFTLEIMRRGRAIKGIGAEASWLLEDNHLIVKPMRALGASDRMRWRLYERPVRAPRLDIGVIRRHSAGTQRCVLARSHPFAHERARKWNRSEFSRQASEVIAEAFDSNS